MLDNHRGLEIRREFLDAINRGQRFGTIDEPDPISYGLKRPAPASR